MWRNLLIAFLVAGCAQLPQSPEDIQAKRFEPVAGQSVIYLIRDLPDFSDRAAPVMINYSTPITTYPGTYIRWEVAPGEHRIEGFAMDAGRIVLRTEPGRIYFVLQRTPPWGPWPQSHFQLLDEQHGRAAVMRGELLYPG
jgi:hypothetical protein